MNTLLPLSLSLNRYYLAISNNTITSFCLSLNSLLFSLDVPQSFLRRRCSSYHFHKYLYLVYWYAIYDSLIIPSLGLPSRYALSPLHMYSSSNNYFLVIAEPTLNFLSFLSTYRLLLVLVSLWSFSWRLIIAFWFTIFDSCFIPSLGYPLDLLYHICLRTHPRTALFLL